jgi:hypothetical protein
MPSAPTAAELLQNPLVKQALDQAWIDSEAGDPSRRHEEGGWIYLDVSNRTVTIRRAISGGQRQIDLGDPPLLPMSVIVATFHTHPNPTAEGWNPRPSYADIVADWRDGVPGLVVSDQGVFVSGPPNRRGGLVGPPGYPL